MIKSEHANHKEREKKNREKAFNPKRQAHDQKPHQADNNMVQADDSSSYTGPFECRN